MPKYERQIQILISDEVSGFLSAIPPTAARKFDVVFGRVRAGEMNAQIFKKLQGTDIWEFRIEDRGLAFRVFAFWDTTTNSLIVTTHGLNKKTQKTPLRDIQRAEALRQQYFTTKTDNEQ